MPSAIRTRDVWKTYQMGEQTLDAVAGIDMDVAAGAYLALTGPSGSGKSTLLHLLGALDTPSRGSVEIAGVDTAGMREKELARVRADHLGFVFQSFNLVPRVTALENVIMPMSFAGQKQTRAQRRAHGMAMLERVGLGERAGHAPHELSGGQRQRVAIARALINDPEVILADEPTGNLDSATGLEVLDLIDELRDEGRTIIMVTHDIEVSARADLVLQIKDGRVVDQQQRLQTPPPLTPPPSTPNALGGEVGSPPGGHATVMEGRGWT